VSIFIHNPQTINEFKEDKTFFTRKGKLSFSSITILLMNLFKDSVEYSLTTFLPELSCECVTGAAFSLARYKIKLEFFLELNNMMTEHILELPPKLWNGFQLVAGDGTTVNMPSSPKIKEHSGGVPLDTYSVSGEKTKTCLASACMLYDVLSGFVLDSIIAPISIGESMLISPLLKNLKTPNALILLDRGFGYFWMIKLLLVNGLSFCIRLKASQSDFAKKALSNPLDDFITEWSPSEAERATTRNQNLDINPITVRVTKITLISGEIELLVSSILDLESITTTQISELYQLRWAVEEGYKDLKPKMKLEQFGCRHYKGIYQEFYAHIFMLNLTSLLGNQAQKQITQRTEKRKLSYQYNWQNAFKFVRDKFINLVKLADIQGIIDNILTKINNSITAIKDGRSFERIKHHKRKNRYTQCYK
jgi:Transposase DDE domain